MTVTTETRIEQEIFEGMGPDAGLLYTSEYSNGDRELPTRLSIESVNQPDNSSVADVPLPCDVPATAEDRLLSQARQTRLILAGMFSIGLVWLLSFAQAILIPITMSIVLFLLLRPVVRWMARRHIPEAAGAAVSLTVVVSCLILGILPLINPARDWLEHLPEHVRKAEQKLRFLRNQMGHIAEIKTKINDLTNVEDEQHPMTVAVQQPELTDSTVMLSTTGNTLGMIVVVIVLTYFLLTAGDLLIRNMLSILPTFREKRQTVELILDVQRGISSYLVTITMINIGLGLVVSGALWLLGVSNPGIWGLMTTVFNYVPFAGQAAVGILLGLFSLLNFDSVGYALLIPLVFYVIAAIEGNFITPALLGSRMSLNPIIVLVSLLFWGWIWGIAGAALAVPLLAIVKIGCDRFECTRSLGTLLGG